MSKIATLKIKDFEYVFRKQSFNLLRQKGSHRIYGHKDGRKVVLPVHKGKTIKEGLANKIITKDLNISIVEFLNILKNQ
ncbi:MAG TPA: type II toxin-antitoxin system HicA family toxin [Ignavibacteria bacterium]